MSFSTSASDLSRRRPLGLKIDQALLLVHNELMHENLTVSWLSDYCYQCLYQDLVSVPMSNTPGKSSIVAVAVDSQHPITLHLNGTGAGREFPRIHYHFGEFGNYSLVVNFGSGTKMISCNIIINESPVNSHLRTASSNCLRYSFVLSSFNSAFPLLHTPSLASIRSSNPLLFVSLPPFWPEILLLTSAKILTLCSAGSSLSLSSASPAMPPLSHTPLPAPFSDIVWSCIPSFSKPLILSLPYLPNSCLSSSTLTYP
uniref:Uncharacterized protein n=1 Tax=Gopherus agassizii TaxID=38772 RepID=A0A452GUT5_9SAUR